jgi:DNA-binding NarL/FixJ family response regulator
LPSAASAISTLIVDDEADMRLLIRMDLELANDGFSVAGEAATGEEALILLEDCDPVVVILDHTMPGMSGLDTAAIIRERRPSQRMILCTAFLTPQLQHQADELGIDACLSKTDIRRLPAEARRLAAAS